MKTLAFLFFLLGFAYAFKAFVTPFLVPIGFVLGLGLLARLI